MAHYQAIVMLNCMKPIAFINLSYTFSHNAYIGS